jgi:hypothetical protein
MQALRGIFYSIVAFLASVLLSLVTTPPRNYPGVPRGTHPLLARGAEGAWTTLNWATQYPLYVGIGVTVGLFPFVVAEIVSRVPRRIHRDPQRLFTSGQKQAGGARAAGRCEMENLLFLRCRRPGEHGDHWYPHSKGGASDMDNYVHACAFHNLAKGGRIPSFWETQRLEWRRRRYFPVEHASRPGSKFRW